MAIPLSNQRRWQFAAGVTFVACVYIFLTGTEYAASVFASRAELPSLERAVRLSPGNADYRHRLGRYFAFVAGGPPSAPQSLRAAGQLNPHDARYLFEYVRYLIAAHRPDAAMSAWEQTAGILGLSAYLPTEDNLVVNGNFSLDILNGGFDWTYVNRIGVQPLLDSSDFRQGQRSLSLTFEGPGINDAGIQQLIPVRGATTYEFSAYYKSADFEGAGGPQIVLRDAYTGAPLFASDTLNDSDFWKEVHSKVTTPNSTTLLSLAIERFPAGSPIRGKLWLGDFELAPEDTSSDASDSSSDGPATNSPQHGKESR